MDTLNDQRTSTRRPQPSTVPYSAPGRDRAISVANSPASVSHAVPHEQIMLHLSWRPLVYGPLAALALLAFYLGIITLAQGWSHAIEQLMEDRWFVGAIIIGFGTQLGLFTYLRDLHTRAMSAGVVGSTATSTVAMLACCAHHVADILPVIGLSGAAIFLNAYKTPLLWLGIATNVMGIVYLLYRIEQARTTLTGHEYPAPD